MKFKTKIVQIGNNTGIEVPQAAVEKLGGGLRPLVVIQINGYSYRGAVGKMNEMFLISLSAEHRNKAGVKGGEQHEITITLDREPRTIDIPAVLKKVFDKHKAAFERFNKLPPSKQKAAVNSIIEAKSEETRDRRIDKLLESLGK